MFFPPSDGGKKISYKKVHFENVFLHFLAFVCLYLTLLLMNVYRICLSRLGLCSSGVSRSNTSAQARAF